MRLHLLYSLAFLVLVFSLTACAPHRPPVAGRLARVPSEEELLSKLRSRTEQWRNLQAGLQISAESSKGKFPRIRTLVLAIPPKQVRIEAFNPWGQAVGAMVSNEQGFSLFIPSEKIVLTAGSAETLIEYFIGVPIPAETFMYSIMASVPPRQLANFQLQMKDSEWVGYSKDTENNRDFAWRFLPDPLSLKAVEVRQGQWSYRVSYDPPVPLDPREVPRKISYNSSQWSMQVTVNEMKSPAVLAESAFKLPLPSGTRTVDLDEIKWSRTSR